MRTALIFAAVVLAACSGSSALPTTGTPTPKTVNLETDFVLRVGQRAVADEERLQVELLGVVDDSRCPLNAVCVWQGEAGVAIRMTLLQADGPAATADTLRTVHEPHEVSRFGYRVILKAVEPYPAHTSRIPQADYRVRLSVERVTQ